MTVRYFNGSQMDGESKPEFTNFPDGQPHAKIHLCGKFERAEIHCSIRTPAELFNLFLVWDIVRKNQGNVKVFIYWLFGARMDRPIDAEQPFTFSIVRDLLYSHIPAESIHLLDLHNQSMMPASFHLDLLPIAETVLKDCGPCDIYFPDKGAAERYANLFPTKHGYNILVGKKLRDSQTGKLSGFALESGERKNSTILFWDDICDGGGTFLGQFDVVMALGYNAAMLYTTHGLFTKGTNILTERFASIYYTNSYNVGRLVDGFPTANYLKLIKQRGGWGMELGEIRYQGN